MRPLHENTSWQKAQMEFCAQREVSLKDGEKSFTLMSDSKYGFRAKRGDLSMSLLRSACYPDPRAEEGRHIFTYLVSVGDEREDRESLDRQLAPLYHVPQALKPIQGITNEGHGLVQLDLLKRAEDAEDVIIARLHETMGSRNPTTLFFAEDIVAVETTNLCEEGTEARWEVDPISHAITLPFGSFEIKTLRLFRRQ
jgi:alpha-mannosidase